MNIIENEYNELEIELKRDSGRERENKALGYSQSVLSGAVVAKSTKTKGEERSQKMGMEVSTASTRGRLGHWERRQCYGQEQRDREEER